MNHLDIAVIIVTYKSAQLAIKSVLSIEGARNGPGVKVRVVIVDNASGDFDEISRAIDANNWSGWVTLILAPRNGGFAYGNNLGIERAYQSGAPAYCYLLNPDTEVRTDAISSLVRFMEAHPDVGIAGSGIDNPDGSEWPIAFRFPNPVSELIGGLRIGLVTRLLRRWAVVQRMSKVSQPIDWVSGASMMIRPTVLATIGSLDENYFLYFEETDFCLRAKRAGFATWYVPQARIMHLEGQSTKVNEYEPRPKRLPPYWFESRRRFFAVNYGVGRAMLIDIVALMARAIGVLTRLLTPRMHTVVPCFIRDLNRHSVLWPRNRLFPPVRTFRFKI